MFPGGQNRLTLRGVNKTYTPRWLRFAQLGRAIRQRITGLKAKAAESLTGTDSLIGKIERSLDVIEARLRKLMRSRAHFGRMRKARLHS